MRSRVEYHVVEYYRLVRNYLVHKTKLSRVEDARRRLLQDWKVELAVTFGGRPAPTVPAELSYDDYKVYTRAVTHLASVLNDACDLRPAEIAAHLLGESQLVQRIRQRLQSPRKARRLVEKTCVLRYATTSEFAAEAADTVLMAIGGDELARRTLP